MTDSMFEQSLDRQIRAYADGGVQPFDRYAIAEGLINSGVRRRRFAWLPALARPVLSPSLAIVVIGLLLALVAALVAGALLLRMQLNQPPGRNGVIAYALWDLAERPYNHLHIVNADGTNDREVAQGAAAVYSTDGQTLTYFSGWGAGSPDLRLVQGERRRVESARSQRLPPDRFLSVAGRLQVLPRRPETDGGRSGPAGMDFPQRCRWFATAVAPGTAVGQRYMEFVWSPDGSHIAYSAMQEVKSGDNSGEYRAAIDIVDVATGTTNRLTSRPGTDTLGAAWLPDRQLSRLHRRTRRRARAFAGWR